jgi:uncharacterized protein (DUF927 family)
MPGLLWFGGQRGRTKLAADRKLKSNAMTKFSLCQREMQTLGTDEQIGASPDRALEPVIGNFKANKRGIST